MILLKVLRVFLKPNNQLDEEPFLMWSYLIIPSFSLNVLSFIILPLSPKFLPVCHKLFFTFFLYSPNNLSIFWRSRCWFKRLASWWWACCSSLCQASTCLDWSWHRHWCIRGCLIFCLSVCMYGFFNIDRNFCSGCNPTDPIITNDRKS